MIPMFPFSISNSNLRFFPSCQEEVSVDEDALRERLSQALVQSFPNKKSIKVSAILVLEGDGDLRRTIVINETISPNGANHSQKMEIAFPGSLANPSAGDSSNPHQVILSQRPLFPATMEGLQALLNLTSSSMNRPTVSDASVHNTFSFLPVSSDGGQSRPKTEKCAENSEAGGNSRKRKAERPCRIPQDLGSELSGLDLTFSGKPEGDVRPGKYCQRNEVAIWPCPGGSEGRPLATVHPIILPRPRKALQLLPGHKKSSKVFNCNQCKLQFTSLNSLCKHTFSEHRAFRCTFCSANFTQRSNLQRHSLKHVGFKPFICNVCGKAYYRKDHLVRHIEVSHPGSDPKSNITVKLSSSECLEYLEKMQTNKMLEDEGRLMATSKSSPLSEGGQAEQVPLDGAWGQMQGNNNKFLSEGKSPSPGCPEDRDRLPSDVQGSATSADEEASVKDDYHSGCAVDGDELLSGRNAELPVETLL